MQLGVTTPLQRFLKLPPLPYGDEAEPGVDPFFCWDVHRTQLGRVRRPSMQPSRADTLVVVNAHNRFAAIVGGMTTFEWKRWDEVALDAIERSIVCCGFSQVQADAYLARAGRPSVTRTHGRQAVAALNVMVADIWNIPLERDEQFQEQLCIFANDLICRAAGFEERGYSTDRFDEDLSRVGIVGSTE